MLLKNKKKILIFGGSGLLGSHLVKNYIKSNDVKWTYSKFLIKTNKNLRFNFNKSVSKKKIKKIINEFKPHVIINCIGLVSVDDCEKNPKLADELNCKFVRSIIEVLNKAKKRNCYFVQISSGGVYGNHDEGLNKFWKEEDELNPLSTYAITKIKGEIEAKKYHGPSLIIRSDFYGINKFKKQSSLLSWIIYNAKNQNRMDGWENVYFSPISCDKLSKVIIECINKNIVGTFNIGSEDGCNKFQFVDSVCKNLSLKPKIIKEEVISKLRQRTSVLSCDKIKSLLPYYCDWELELKKYITKLITRI